jgi:hypothetical protein
MVILAGLAHKPAVVKAGGHLASGGPKRSRFEIVFHMYELIFRKAAEVLLCHENFNYLAPESRAFSNEIS